ncbi:hypothetical protein ACFYZB_39795 [Streptomyces sp. NPDC001852]|uniref:hypothetical protein n=1 Tax=Streptomyces sp. NPDC001852 TaxID=3364619 RepID=UPI0036B2809A
MGSLVDNCRVRGQLAQAGRSRPLVLTLCRVCEVADLMNQLGCVCEFDEIRHPAGFQCAGFLRGGRVSEAA